MYPSVPANRSCHRLVLLDGCLAPVSYTHLDVYKRQMYTSGKYKFRYRQKNGYDITETRKNGDVEAIRAELSLIHICSGDRMGFATR